MKALIAAKEREHVRRTRSIKLERADVLLSYSHDEEEKIEIQARVLLNNLEVHGTQLYSTDSLKPNLKLEFTLSHPQKFTLQAKVIWCQYQSSSSHIITEKKFPYRIGLAFSFADEAKKEEFSKFCDEMKDRYAYLDRLILEASSESHSKPASEAAPTPSDVPSHPEEEKKAA